ncbi:MAG: hypothetical protein HKN09_05450 [Saprospiraceae bacterium]|nr:hypothetical protein [Saprospiraceae bacterium]
MKLKTRKDGFFGAENQAKWTQVIYRNKYSFQNPLRQTFRQKKILSQFLNITESLIFPVIYFAGNCQFKTEVPLNVIRSRPAKHIKAYKSTLLQPEEVESLIYIIKQHLAQSVLRKKDHLRSLKQRHASFTTCPHCGNQLVERIAKRGLREGKAFLGCASYPKCRFTKDI